MEKGDYEKEGIEYLYSAISTGIDWGELLQWMSKWEKPVEVARLMNRVAIGQSSKVIAKDYLRRLHVMVCDGDAEKAMDMLLEAAQNVHNCMYYFRNSLSNRDLLSKLSAVSDSRWSLDGFVGEKEAPTELIE